VENKITGHSLQSSDDAANDAELQQALDEFNEAMRQLQESEATASADWSSDALLSLSWADFKNKMSNWTHSVENKITGHSLQGDDGSNDAELQAEIQQLEDLLNQLEEQEDAALD